MNVAGGQLAEDAPGPPANEWRFSLAHLFATMTYGCVILAACRALNLSLAAHTAGCAVVVLVVLSRGTWLAQRSGLLAYAAAGVILASTLGLFAWIGYSALGFGPLSGTKAEDAIIDVVSILVVGGLSGAILGCGFEALLGLFGIMPWIEESFEDQLLPPRKLVRSASLLIVPLLVVTILWVVIPHTLLGALNWTSNRAFQNQRLTPCQQLVAPEFDLYDPVFAYVFLRACLVRQGVYEKKRYRFEVIRDRSAEFSSLWKEIVDSTTETLPWQIESPHSQNRMLIDVWYPPAERDYWERFFRARGGSEISDRE